MRRVLITGASGCLGRHCLAPLVERAGEVHALTRRGVGVPGATAHAFDLLAPDGLDELVKRIRPTHLLHLAWETAPDPSRCSARRRGSL